METRAQQEDRALRQLRDDFTGHRIWRSRRGGGQAGDWVATLHDSAAGVDPTVIRPNAGELRAALVEERKRVPRAAKRVR
ncbi:MULTISPECIES: hypothetical protein [Actinomadura]|uniref:Uncharacterized protein n=1 Tax=Actinomadura litoris TaxID=2678616 RepID=A0A7K1L1L7_9ACTN|nr:MULTISPECIES: hypothetical protein [Actinomadura]MBT2206855.1 hypothetical protein [Actinomadura sp. NEAU-AAG7]MUN38193.1 hypothetical protein [Actinomadura litoris]